MECLYKEDDDRIFTLDEPFEEMGSEAIEVPALKEEEFAQITVLRLYVSFPNEAREFTFERMDDPNITMDEYIRLDEEKAQKRGETLSCEPTVSYLNDEIDFKISFDDSDDEDYTVIFNKNSFSYKIISTNDLKTDSENDNEKVNIPSFLPPEPKVSYFDDLDFFKDFENEFPAIVYNDALTSKLDFLTEPTVSPQHIDEFNLKDKTSFSECDEEEQNVLNFNYLFPFNVIYPNDSKSDKDNDDDKVDIEHSSRDLSVKPLPDILNTDDLSESNIDEYWWRIYKSGDLKVLES
ncbi:hypothetical protein Tco_1419479 [Tanacetum coccineum]